MPTTSSINTKGKEKKQKNIAKRQRHKGNVAGQKVSFSTTAWLLSPGTCYSAEFFIQSLSLLFPCLCCGGIVTVQVTRREWQQQALSDRSPEPSQLGREPSRGKFTPTPSWLVPFLDVSLGMAEERGLGSGGINVILHISILRESWKWLNVSSAPRLAKWKREAELHDKSTSRCRISHTKQMTASRCEASRMKLLANEKEQVWISMTALRKTRRKEEESISRCWIFLGRKKNNVTHRSPKSKNISLADGLSTTWLDKATGKLVLFLTRYDFRVEQLFNATEQQIGLET